ncbi:fimbrial protein [Erwinia sp. ErVv1]|uniref:fimbrial protein n=1 Tax=Erwinia sp. ErVv1 TaxID=1603299 RepID=UPI0008306EB6|nr:fimbrial protein [Erwinia sp. ErVv1]
MKYCIYAFVVLISSLCTPLQANCTRVRAVDQGCDACGASLNLGNIGLMDLRYQPAGTVLARSVFQVVPSIKNSDPERVLYECDLADKDKIFEVFATNGDSNVGGAWNMGDNYFQTYFPFTALKLVHLRSGKPFTRIWQKVPLTDYDVSGNKILIKGKHFSPIGAELIRTDKNNRDSGYASWGCPSAAKDSYTGSYNCNQPNGYVVFMGPGQNVPEAGKDSWNNFDTWITGRYMAFGMNTAPVATLTQNRSQGCRVENYTAHVLFPSVSINALSQGQSVSAPLSVTLECSNAAETQSGVASGQISLGFQSSYAAWLQAQKLGLTGSNGISDYLVSDHYDSDPSLATGVGIKLNTSSGEPVSFLGWSDYSSNAGWRPVLEDAQRTRGGQGDSNMYQRNFVAQLAQLPGKNVSVGKIDATAYLLIRLQ